MTWDILVEYSNWPRDTNNDKWLRGDQGKDYRSQDG